MAAIWGRRTLTGSIEGDKAVRLSTGVDLYDSESICDMMGGIARAWFGVDWACVAQVWV